MSTIKIEAGEETEGLLQFVLSGISDDTLDLIDVKRDIAPQSGLACEPITTAVVLTLATTSVIAITRLIERWMEHRRQQTVLRIVSEGFARSSEEGKALLELSRSYSEVMVEFGAISVQPQLGGLDHPPKLT